MKRLSLILFLLFLPLGASAGSTDHGAYIESSVNVAADTWSFGTVSGCMGTASGSSDFFYSGFSEASTTLGESSSGCIDGNFHISSISLNAVLAPHASSTGYYYSYFCSGTGSCNAYTGGQNNAIKYAKFYWTGSDVIIPTGGLGNTIIDFVKPISGTTISGSTTPLEASGYLSETDGHWGFDKYGIDSGLSISWRIQGIANNCLDVICAANSTAIYRYEEPIIASYDGAQSFDVSSSTTMGFTKTGIYQMYTTLRKPSTFFGFQSFFGLFNFGFDSLYSTTTLFTVGTSTALDRLLASVGSAGLTGTTTEATMNSCIPIPGYFSLSDCVYTLFVPSTRPDFESTFGAVAAKPPFGYFTAFSNLLKNATTSTASTTPFGMEVMANILSPIRTGLSLILWFALGMWIFHRVRNFNFQS